MRQEVIIGPDLIDYFVECDMDITEPDSFGDLFPQLRRDIILWNEELQESFIDQITSNKDYIGNKSGAIIQFWEKDFPRLKRAPVGDLKEIKFKELTNEDKVEYALVEASKDKIWLKSEENTKRLETRKQNKSNGTIKLPISFKDYINPVLKKNNDILKLSYPYEVEMGGYFPFRKFITILLNDAKKIKIEDTYIYHHKGAAKKNLEFIFSLVDQSVPIKIITHSINKYTYLKNKVNCSACKWTITDIEFDDHKEKCRKAKLAYPIEIKPDTFRNLVRCSACKKELIDRRHGEFDNHVEECVDKVIPTPLAVEPDEEIKMVRCSVCKKELIERDGEFDNHVEECVDQIKPTPSEMNPVQDLVNELKSKYNNVSIEYKDKGLHKRKIETDKFKIIIDAGLSPFVKDNQVDYNNISFIASKNK